MKKIRKAYYVGLSLLLGLSSLSSIVSCKGTENNPSTENPSTSTPSTPDSSDIVPEPTPLVIVKFNQNSQLKEDTTVYFKKGLEYSISASAIVNNAESEVEYISTNNEVASFIGSILKVNGAGTTEIRAHAKGIDDSSTDAVFTLTVLNQVSFDSVSLDKEIIKVGETAKISYKLLNGDEKSVVKFSSNNETVASVASDGTITANSNGTAQIIVDLFSGEEKIDTRTLSITVSDSMTIVINNSQDLNVETTDSGTIAVSLANIDTSSLFSYSYTLEYDDQVLSNVSFDEVSNHISYTSIKQGTSTLVLKLTYKLSEDSLEEVISSNIINVTVTDKVSISFEGDSTTIDYGTSLKLKVNATINNTPTTNYTFSLSEEGIIEIDQEGNVTVLSDGTVKIIATLTGYETLENAKAEFILVVNPVYEFEVITPNELTIETEGKSIVTFSAKKNNQVDANPQIGVSVENEEIIAFDSKTNSITGLKVGTTTIQFTYYGIIKTVTIHVEGKVSILPNDETFSYSYTWKENETLSDDEILNQFKAVKEGDPSYSSKLVLELTSGDSTNWSNRSFGIYSIVIKTEDGKGVSRTINVEIIKNLLQFSIYYWDHTTDIPDYSNLDSLWMWDKTGKPIYIEQVTDGQVLPENYAFREEIKLNSQGEEDPSGTINVLKFTIDFSLKYDVSDNTDFAAPQVASRNIQIEEINSGAVIRHRHGNQAKQTRDFVFATSKIDAENPIVGVYANDSVDKTSIEMDGKVAISGNIYSAVYNLNDLVNYETVEKVVNKVNIYYRFTNDYAINFSGVDRFYIFNGTQAKTIIQQLTQIDKNGTTYYGFSVDLSKPVEYYNGWSNEESAKTTGMITLDEFCKLIFINQDEGWKVGNDLKQTFNINLDLVSLKHGADENGNLNLYFNLTDRGSSEKLFTVDKLMVGDNNFR